jgi:hypothetical protein
MAHACLIRGSLFWHFHLKALLSITLLQVTSLQMMHLIKTGLNSIRELQTIIE